MEAKSATYTSPTWGAADYFTSYLSFSKSATNEARVGFVLPTGWAGGELKITIYWSQTLASSNNVYWKIFLLWGQASDTNSAYGPSLHSDNSGATLITSGGNDAWEMQATSYTTSGATFSSGDYVAVSVQRLGARWIVTGKLGP